MSGAAHQIGRDLDAWVAARRAKREEANREFAEQLRADTFELRQQVAKEAGQNTNHVFGGEPSTVTHYARRAAEAAAKLTPQQAMHKLAALKDDPRLWDRSLDPDAHEVLNATATALYDVLYSGSDGLPMKPDGHDANTFAVSFRDEQMGEDVTLDPATGLPVDGGGTDA